MNKMNKIRRNNEKIIATAIDKHFGAGSYEKIKNCREAVAILLDYIIGISNCRLHPCFHLRFRLHCVTPDKSLHYAGQEYQISN